jgi:hypothetical protein
LSVNAATGEAFETALLRCSEISKQKRCALSPPRLEALRTGNIELEDLLETIGRGPAKAAGNAAGQTEIYRTLRPLNGIVTNTSGITIIRISRMNSSPSQLM